MNYPELRKSTLTRRLCSENARHQNRTNGTGPNVTIVTPVQIWN